jgi:hypothetical protein
MQDDARHAEDGGCCGSNRLGVNQPARQHGGAEHVAKPRGGSYGELQCCGKDQKLVIKRPSAEFGITPSEREAL